MRFLTRLLFRAVAEVFSRPPPRRGSPVRAPNDGSSIKKKAASGPAVMALIDSFPEAEVISVYDGDTVLVAEGWSEILVRLDSIDCPEDGQDWGDIAKFGLIKLIGGKNVRLEEYGLDDYGRTLATVYVEHGIREEWTNVNERMVTLGHAWVMRAYYDHLPKDRQDKLNRLESWARSKRVGLWRTENPTPPWQWRRRCTGS